jgi:hypothetical protein
MKLINYENKIVGSNQNINDKFEIVTENRQMNLNDNNEKSNAEHTKSDNNFLKPITNLAAEKSVSLSNIAGKIFE